MTEYKLPEPDLRRPDGVYWNEKQAHEIAKAAYAAGLAVRESTVTNEMVSRFLCWPVPPDFYPDGGISFTRFTGPAGMRHEFKPIGTNLLTADQARAMLEYVIAGATK